MIPYPDLRAETGIQVAELVHELPPKSFADRIVDEFFSKMNYVRYPIDERLFRTCTHLSPIDLSRDLRIPSVRRFVQSE